MLQISLPKRLHNAGTNQFQETVDKVRMDKKILILNSISSLEKMQKCHNTDPLTTFQATQFTWQLTVHIFKAVSLFATVSVTDFQVIKYFMQTNR